MPEIVIVDSNGREHVFPDGFDPKRAAAIVQKATAQPPAAPQVTTQQLAAEGPSAMRATRGQAFKQTLQTAKANPGATGALLAGAAAAPFTGGLSLGPAMAVEAAVGAGGAMAGHGTKAAVTGELPSLRDVATDAATQGVIGATGPVIGTGLKLAGRGMYRVALAPIQKVLSKYGDVVGEGLRTATPVSKEGLAKATAEKTTRMATKASALADADQRVAFSSKQISDEASKPLSTYAVKQVRAGLPDPTPDFSDRLAQFRAANPNGSLTPSSLDEIKGTIDDTLGGAYRKVRAREPITGSEKAGMEMSRAMSRANEAAVPQYREMNRSIMDAEGLRQAIERRTLGSGGNQVLDTLLMLLKGPSAIPGRVAMMPEVLSRGGIGAYKAGPVVQKWTPTSLRAALVSALSPKAPEDQR
jgi:hypothetical protein